MAEESGLIRQIGDWVIETVCGDLERWRAESRAIVPVSINVSSRQFAEADMSRADRRCADPALPRSSLARDRAHGELDPRERRAHGDLPPGDPRRSACESRSTISEPATPRSAYLNRVPLDLLKIDHSLRARYPPRSGRARVSSPQSSRWHTASALEVVAEGADCDEQVDVLVKIGCDCRAGFRLRGRRCRSASSPCCSVRARALLPRWRLRARRARKMRAR